MLDLIFAKNYGLLNLRKVDLDFCEPEVDWLIDLFPSHVSTHRARTFNVGPCNRAESAFTINVKLHNQCRLENNSIQFLFFPVVHQEVNCWVTQKCCQLLNSPGAGYSPGTKDPWAKVGSSRTAGHQVAKFLAVEAAESAAAVIRRFLHEGLMPARCKSLR